MNLHANVEANLAQLVAKQVPDRVQDKGIAAILLAVAARKDSDENLDTHFDMVARGAELIKASVVMSMVELITKALHKHKDPVKTVREICNLTEGAVAALDGGELIQTIQQTDNIRDLLVEMYPGLTERIEREAAAEKERNSGTVQ